MQKEPRTHCNHILLTSISHYCRAKKVKDYNQSTTNQLRTQVLIFFLGAEDNLGIKDFPKEKLNLSKQTQVISHLLEYVTMIEVSTNKAIVDQ